MSIWNIFGSEPEEETVEEQFGSEVEARTPTTSDTEWEETPLTENEEEIKDIELPSWWTF
jgi:hypothetical protein